MGRIVATPAIGYMIVTGMYDVAIYSFFVAGFFDWLDGYLARRWNQTSVFGSFLDPLADKVFVGVTLFSLIYIDMVPWQLGVIIVGRDFLLVAGSFYMRYKTKPKDVRFFSTAEGEGVMAVEPSTISKFNTLAQFGLIWFTMTHLSWGIPSTDWLPICWGIVSASTIVSGFDYYRRSNHENIFKKQTK